MPTLQFKGRVFVENHHLAVPYHEWRPLRSKGLSTKASLHDNLIIEGDNLAALKALLPTHHRKVKCIYQNMTPWPAMSSSRLPARNSNLVR